MQSFSQQAQQQSCMRDQSRAWTDEVGKKNRPQALEDLMQPQPHGHAESIHLSVPETAIITTTTRKDHPSNDAW